MAGRDEPRDALREELAALIRDLRTCASRPPSCTGSVSGCATSPWSARCWPSRRRRCSPSWSPGRRGPSWEADVNRQLRDDLVAAGFEPKAAVVLASVIPDVERPLAELRTDVRADMHRGFANMHREFDRQRNLTIGSTLLIIATLAVSKILGG